MRATRTICLAAMVAMGCQTAPNMPPPLDQGFDSGMEDTGTPLDAAVDAIASTDMGMDSTVSDSGTEAGTDVLTAPGTTPRPIAPMSTATVTSQTPTLHWTLATGTDGARVQLCSDRACTMGLQTLDVTGTSVGVPSALESGAYYWRLASLTGGTVGTGWSPTWEFFVGHLATAVDTSWGTVPDFNGDGYADVVVGENCANPLTSPCNYNNANLYYGAASGVSTVDTIIAPLGTFGFGNSVASAGDVNGDGFADLIVSAAGSFTAYVYLGSASGITGLAETLVGSGTDLFGTSVAGAGDLNGDGYADVVVGGQTAVFVFFGGASGVFVTPTVLTGPAGSLVGTSSAWAGDVNGDGYGDLVVGNPHGSEAFVYLGAAMGLQPTALNLNGAGGSGFGNSVAGAGDVNGDGYADVIVGAANNDLASVFLGNSTGISTTATILVGRGGSGPVGVTLTSSPVAGAGDVNGDGYADVIVGDGSASLAAYLYLGGAGGVSTTSTPVMPPSVGTYFGGSAAGAGDVNGDGYGDVLVGAYGSATTSLFFGSPSGLGTTPTVLVGPSTSDFGVSVARVDTGLASPRIAGWRSRPGGA